jgi:cytochrome oxidase Cu insertion factor (SCO1/SenC/PrrC family)
MRGSHFIGLGLICLAALSGCEATPSENDHLSLVPDFQLSERSGRTVSRDDLKGKVWVAAFVFTRCAGPCSQISGAMAQLQNAVVSQKDVVLVSITVDPEHDTPKVLDDYATKFNADANRWLFLTGEPVKVYSLIRDGFKLGVEQNQGTARTPGNEVMHSTRLALVDRRGEIRGYYDGTDVDSLAKLKKKIALLLREK